MNDDTSTKVFTLFLLFFTVILSSRKWSGAHRIHVLILKLRRLFFNQAQIVAVVGVMQYYEKRRHARSEGGVGAGGLDFALEVGAMGSGGS